MKSSVFLFALLFCISYPIGAGAQIQLVSNEYFPADMEFRELQPSGTPQTIHDAAALVRIDAGSLLAEVGFENLSQQTYAVSPLGALTIEIFTLKDARAAYSMLTLLRGSQVIEGPPGNAYSIIAGELIFAHGSRWIRLRGQGIAQDLLRRVAASVSNRMGPSTPTSPSLIRHLPNMGLDRSTVRYFLGPQSFQKYSLSMSGVLGIKFLYEMEIAQAQYALEGESGLLSLVSFPTSQMAEDYFERIAGLGGGPTSPGGRAYVKKAGPLLAVLEGSFDPSTADNILGTIQFAYSIKWIYDRNNSSNSVFGVPIRVLGTVVRSIVFVGLLALASIVVGAGMAFLRIGVRTYAPNSIFGRQDQKELIRLKINED